MIGDLGEVVAFSFRGEVVHVYRFNDEEDTWRTTTLPVSEVGLAEAREIMAAEEDPEVFDFEEGARMIVTEERGYVIPSEELADVEGCRPVTVHDGRAP